MKNKYKQLKLFDLQDKNSIISRELDEKDSDSEEPNEVVRYTQLQLFGLEDFK